ncbi:MAG TPA: efflux RND transporter permease subunit [Vicinamibacterales bacterium]|nr:efflux RND transporter permease subunit [Vicinamibacterales bacterium]
MSIPRIAIERPVTMFMISGVIVLLGLISLYRLPVDLMPDITYPSITVRVGYAGVGPAEIEELIVRPLEQSLAAVPGLEQVNSTAAEGSGTVRLNFAWGTDLNDAADEVRTRVDRVRGRLPEEADAPSISKFDSSSSPIMTVGVDGDYDRVTLREIAENDLVPRFERVEGVAAVTVSGGLRRQIHIELSKEKITAMDLSVDRVVNTIRAENQNTPLGEVIEGDTSFLLRSQGQFQNLAQIKDLIVQTKGGIPVYLRDIAEVRDTTEDLRSFSRINGKPGVRLQITKQSGKNTVAIAASAKAEIERTNREVPTVRLTLLDDQSKYIEQSIAAVKEHVNFGAVLVIAIIFLFLRDLRSTLIICTSIPVSVVGTFALLYFAGFTLNTMTFGGLALGVGMIVDASIVVLENAFRHMEHGKSRLQAAIDGSEEVWSAILASTLTHVAVFVPLLFLTGVSSVLFVQLSVVVMFSLMMSLFVAVTIVPVLCSRLLKLPPPESERKGLFGKLFTWSEHVFTKLDDSYRAAIHLALQHRPTVLMAAAGLTALAFVILPTIPSELVPQTDEGEVSISARMPVGTRVERTEAVALQLERLVQDNVPEAVTIMSNAGGGGFGGGSASSANLTVKLTPRTERKRTNDQIATDLRRVLVGIPGAQITTRASGGNNQLTRALGGGNTNSRLAVEIRGNDLADSARVAQQVLDVLKDTPGIANPQIGREDGRPELAIRVDRPKAAMLGLTVQGVASTIRTNISGTQAAFFRERGKEFPIIVRLREEDRERAESVNDVLISTPSGLVLPAGNVLDLRPQTGPTQIERKNQQRIARVNAELDAGVALGEAVKDVQARLPAVTVPEGFSVGFGAEVEQQATAFQQLQVLLVLGVLLVYAVMASQYESLRDPFIVMFSVPVAAIGVVLALKLTATSFSLQAYIGVIMLAGIVVSNAILLVDYTNVLRKRDGVPLRDAVELAGRTRLRPILMTSLATILGLVPMSLGIGEGAELQAPLGRVVIGGLAASTLVTLVLVPAVYTLFEEGFAGLRRGAAHSNPERA